MANSNPTSHYDEEYWRFQESIGRFGGRAEVSKFAPYILPNDCVLDYGCGGGFILANLNCRRRLGVEVNPIASRMAVQQGIETFLSIGDLPAGLLIDVVISNHALEHVESPLKELRALRGLLKPGGRLILVVPSENRRAWDPLNINKHLYTWAPLNLGNLITAAGFQVEQCEQRNTRWPPRPQMIQKYLGWKVFHLLSQLRGNLFRDLGEVIAIAHA